MTTQIGTAEAGELTHAITALLDSAFEAVGILGGQVADLYRRHPQAHAANLAELRPAVLTALRGTSDLLVGAGLVVGPGALADADLGVEWWTRWRTAPSRIAFELDPESPSYFDLTRLPWFAGPRDTGAEHVAGPHLDAAFTDEYALTLSAPVRHDGRFVGVAAAVLSVRALVDTLLPALRALDADALLVNQHGSVVVSAAPRYTTGSTLREPRLAVALADGSPEAGGFTLHRCGRHPLTLIADQH